MRKVTLLLALFALALTACRFPWGEKAGQVRMRDADGMAMVYVPAGKFTMGSDDAAITLAAAMCGQFSDGCTRDTFADEQPTHTVTLDAFWIDRTEVSNAQYRRCVAAGACTSTGCPDDADLNGDAQPAVCVSWTQAQAYCAWAGGRLPTEAEWEYAARGPAGLLYPWGNAFDGTRLNYCDTRCPLSRADPTYDDGFARTAPVGSYPTGASWCGALDMAGNAWEWVQDWYGPYTPEPQDNPLMEAGFRGRVLRGGSWDLDPAYSRATVRNYGPTDGSSNVSGFRCAVPAGP